MQTFRDLLRTREIKLSKIFFLDPQKLAEEAHTIPLP